MVCKCWHHLWLLQTCASYLVSVNFVVMWCAYVDITYDYCKLVHTIWYVFILWCVVCICWRHLWLLQTCAYDLIRVNFVVCGVHMLTPLMTIANLCILSKKCSFYDQVWHDIFCIFNPMVQYKIKTILNEQVLS
jgi:hypothetical protein